MKFTLSWLKSHLETNAALEEITKALTNLGIEVEDVLDLQKVYQNFVIAEIEEALHHPNAAKLRVCTVYDGREKLQVVCGAPNARSGIKVVLAPVGTIIPESGLVIKRAEIRGCESSGMLCSSRELSLNDDHEGIIELPSSAEVGRKFAEFAGLDDIVIDVALTPNRGDLASVYGIARDLAAKGIGKLISTKGPFVKLTQSNDKIEVNIEDKDACYAFLTRRINAVSARTSRCNRAQTLKLIGFSPKSAIVNISNYAMFDLGQPNHIYDADKIRGPITIRKARDGERFVALGGEEFTLDSEILVVADSEKVLAVAGVIGGELSKVDENTKNLLIEVASFNPIDVARSGRKLNIHTDARYRFERRVDSSKAELFLDYLTDSLLQACGGEVSEGASAYGNSPNYISEIDFSYDIVEKVAGFKIEESEVDRILSRLGFIFVEGVVKIPPHRMGDVVGKEDIVEEVLRVYGFENIPTSNISFSRIYTERPLGVRLSNRLRARGLDEVISWSFMPTELTTEFGFVEPITLKNPISQNLSAMRPSIIPNLLHFASKNAARGFEDIAIFEEGHIFARQYAELQSACIAGIRAGNACQRSVHTKERVVDFFDAKADLYAILEEAGIDLNNIIISRDTPQYYHPTRSAAFTLGGKVVAFAGELHPKTLADCDLETRVVAFETFVDNLSQTEATAPRQFSDLQHVKRDFAFIVDGDIEVGAMLSAIRGAGIEILKNVSVFDVYTGSEIGQGKKSVALSITLQPMERTLLDDEIEAISSAIITTLSEQFSAQLR